MIEFEINGQQYRAEKLDAFQQCDVAALLLPLVGGIADTLKRVFREGRPDWGAAVAQLLDSDIAETIEPLAKAFAEMKREDRHFIITTCLSRVSRAQQGAVGWAPVLASNGVVMFPEIRDDLSTVVRLVWKVLEHSLLSFSSARPAAST